MEIIPEAGGEVALHNDLMNTTLKGVFVAGDSSGIEEASTAMIEGKIAGVSSALYVGYDQNAKIFLTQFKDQLKKLRAGPFGEKPREAKRKIDHFMEIKNVKL